MSATSPSEPQPDLPTPDQMQRRIDHFGPRIRALRQERRLTVRELAARCNIAASTISKVENTRMSPTYDIILRLAAGLGVELGTLFVEGATSMALGRRSVTRAGDGIAVTALRYSYEMLSADVSNKRFYPILATIRPGETASPRDYVRHRGEEFVYVLAGSVRILTDLYEPLVLSVGDSCYFDSTMSHLLEPVGAESAIVLWVASDLNADLASSGRPDGDHEADGS